MKNNFSTPGVLWPLLVIICIVVILAGLHMGLQRTGWANPKKRKIFFTTTILILIWLALLIILSVKGFFADFSKLPPRPALAILIPLPVVLIIAFSKSGTKLLKSIPPQRLVFIQSFRIFVELLIWFAFLANKLPVQMTFAGRNYDVLTGILALPVAYVLLKKLNFSKTIAIAFNVLGILLLLNILIIAVLSMPTSLRYFMNEPSSGIVATFPFLLLPGVLVPIAYSFHIFSLRQLLVKKTPSSGTYK